jgi:hypothetical protein
MITLSQQREREEHVEQVREFMGRRDLSLDDLIDIGGEDLRSLDPGLAGKARCVERCWELMAKHAVKHLDLEHSQDGGRPTHTTKRPEGDATEIQI